MKRGANWNCLFRPPRLPTDRPHSGIPWLELGGLNWGVILRLNDLTRNCNFALWEIGQSLNGERSSVVVGGVKLLNLPSAPWVPTAGSWNPEVSSHSSGKRLPPSALFGTPAGTPIRTTGPRAGARQRVGADDGVAPDLQIEDPAQLPDDDRTGCAGQPVKHREAPVAAQREPIPHVEAGMGVIGRPVGVSPRSAERCWPSIARSVAPGARWREPDPIPVALIEPSTECIAGHGPIAVWKQDSRVGGPDGLRVGVGRLARGSLTSGLLLQLLTSRLRLEPPCATSRTAFQRRSRRRFNFQFVSGNLRQRL